MTDWIKDVKDTCYTCKKSKLVNDDMQCSVCYDKGLVECYSCSVVGNYKDLNDKEDGDYLCNDCFQPLCRNCNEEVSEDGGYCSKECYNEYFSE
jgi:hypothetical protein|tara:strand:+ start:1875 stop:2156 length:282 start_codon:yes stop_codon:yes gene_type:complete